jgi:hypothetical protein
MNWLPQVIEGKKLHTQFRFDEAEHLLEEHVHEAAL